jgi:hypothetical protein
MSLKLRFASIWLPEYILKQEIDRVATITLKCLDQLLLKYAPLKLNALHIENLNMKGDIEKRRKIMAEAHNMRVKMLIDEMGYDEAVKVGRDALFQGGLKLGREARMRLDVDNSLQDLIRAARVLYRVLGIEFEVENSEEEIFMMVNRCSLSKYYLPETCRILSAADEGVVRGLNEDIEMKFILRMTDGYSKCKASLNIR